MIIFPQYDKNNPVEVPDGSIQNHFDNLRQAKKTIENQSIPNDNQNQSQSDLLGVARFFHNAIKEIKANQQNQPVDPNDQQPELETIQQIYDWNNNQFVKNKGEQLIQQLGIDNANNDANKLQQQVQTEMTAKNQELPETLLGYNPFPFSTDVFKPKESTQRNYFAYPTGDKPIQFVDHIHRQLYVEADGLLQQMADEENKIQEYQKMVDNMQLSDEERAEAQAGIENSKRIQEQAKEKIEMLSKAGKANGYDMRGLNPEYTGEKINQLLFNEKLRVLKQFWNGGKYGRSSSDYFDDKFDEYRKRGMSDREAYDRASQEAFNYQRERIMNAYDVGMDYVNNGTFTGNPAELIINALSQEGNGFVTEFQNRFITQKDLTTHDISRQDKIDDKNLETNQQLIYKQADHNIREAEADKDQQRHIERANLNAENTAKLSEVDYYHQLGLIDAKTANDIKRLGAQGEYDRALELLKSSLRKDESTHKHNLDEHGKDTDMNRYATRKEIDLEIQKNLLDFANMLGIEKDKVKNYLDMLRDKQEQESNERRTRWTLESNEKINGDKNLTSLKIAEATQAGKQSKENNDGGLTKDESKILNQIGNGIREINRAMVNFNKDEALKWFNWFVEFKNDPDSDWAKLRPEIQNEVLRDDGYLERIIDELYLAGIIEDADYLQIYDRMSLEKLKKFQKQEEEENNQSHVPPKKTKKWSFYNKVQTNNEVPINKYTPLDAGTLEMFNEYTPKIGEYSKKLHDLTVDKLERDIRVEGSKKGWTQEQINQRIKEKTSEVKYEADIAAYQKLIIMGEDYWK